MFGQVGETPLDVRFSIFGTPVRVHPLFWLTAVFLSYRPADARPPLLFLFVLCIFLSIIVHELGHAMTTRLFGWRSEITLWALGGLATVGRSTPGRNILVALAGPAAGLLLAAAIYGSARLQLIPADVSVEVLSVLGFLLWVNLAWSLLNLVPVFPLDGGQVVREVLLWLNPRNGLERSALLSTIVGIAMALAAFRFGKHIGIDGTFAAVFFGFMAYQNYIGWQQIKRGYWR